MGCTVSIRVISRLPVHRLAAGSVFLAVGWELGEADAKSWHTSVGLISQDPFSLDGVSHVPKSPSRAYV